MEQHYPHFKMPENYDYHLTSGLALLDQMAFQSYLMAFSGSIPPDQVEGTANLIVNTLREAKYETKEDLDKARQYIQVLPKVIYLLEDKTVSFDEITNGLKEAGFTPKDIAEISKLATSAYIAERAGDYTIATNPNLDKNTLRVIKTINDVVAQRKAELIKK